MIFLITDISNYPSLLINYNYKTEKNKKSVNAFKKTTVRIFCNSISDEIEKTELYYYKTSGWLLVDLLFGFGYSNTGFFCFF